MRILSVCSSVRLSVSRVDCDKTVEDRPIMSIKYCLPVPVFYFWRKLKSTLQRGLSAIAEPLVIALHLCRVVFPIVKPSVCLSVCEL